MGGWGGHSGEGGGGGAPFIWGLADPSPLPLGSSGTFPLANSHRNESLPRYTEEKENKTPKKQNKIIPALGGERNKQTPGLRSPRTGGSLQPAPRGKEANSVPCCSAQGRRLSCPETPTHWPLVSFFLSFFFLFDTQTINFQKISFSLKKKKNLNCGSKPRAWLLCLAACFPTGCAPRAQPGTSEVTVSQMVHPGPLCSRLGGR